MGVSYCPLSSVRENKWFQAGVGNSGLPGGICGLGAFGAFLTSKQRQPGACVLVGGRVGKWEDDPISYPDSESPGWGAGSCTGEEEPLPSSLSSTLVQLQV